MLKQEKYILAISIGNPTEQYEIIKEDSLTNIDAFTTGFEKSEEIRNLYNAKVQAFEKKVGKKGDIVILKKHEQELKKIKVLYKKHMEPLNKIILIEEFETYLKNIDYSLYCDIQPLKNKNVEFIEKYPGEIETENIDKLIITENNTIEYTDSIGKLIRKICNKYKTYSKENNKPTLDEIYSEIKKRKQKQYEEDLYETCDRYILEEKEERELTKKYQLKHTLKK